MNNISSFVFVKWPTHSRQFHKDSEDCTHMFILSYVFSRQFLEDWRTDRSI